MICYCKICRSSFKLTYISQNSSCWEYH